MVIDGESSLEAASRTKSSLSIWLNSWILNVPVGASGIWGASGAEAPSAGLTGYEDSAFQIPSISNSNKRIAFAFGDVYCSLTC